MWLLTDSRGLCLVQIIAHQLDPGPLPPLGGRLLHDLDHISTVDLISGS